MTGTTKSPDSTAMTRVNHVNNIEAISEIISAPEVKEKPKKLTRRQLVIVLNLAYGNFCLGSLYSIMAPFFPREAEFKGASPTEYGFIFGIYELGIFILSPFIGKMIPHLSPRFLLIMGLFVAGWCNVTFGLLQWSPHGLTFVWLALIMRFVASAGGAAFFTACFTLIATDFPDKVSQLFATTEMSFGLGMIVGPGIGGFLFQIGNFSLPFFASGSMTMFAAFTTFMLLPEPKPAQAKRTLVTKAKKVGVFMLLSKFGIVLNICVCVNTFILIGFNDATLEHHIREIVTLTSTAVGGIFLMGGLVYASCSQIWGFLAQKSLNAHPFCVIGFLSAMTCFVFCGPIYGLPIKPSLGLVIASQIFLSIGIGGQLVGSFTEGLRETIRNGFPDEISTSATVSSLFASSFSLGAAIGPILGGYLLDHYGYSKACIAIVVLQIIMAVTIIAFNLYRKASLNKKLSLKRKEKPKQILESKAIFGLDVSSQSPVEKATNGVLLF